MNPEEPVLTRSQAPQHGPDFWKRLDAELRNDPSIADDDADPVVTSIEDARAVEPQRRGARVLAMAAAAVLIVGAGAFALFGGAGDSSPATELVVEGADTASAVAAAGQVPASETAEQVPIEDAPAPLPTALTVVEGSASGSDDSVTDPPIESDVAFAEGMSLTTTPVYFPSSVADIENSTFLGTWSEQRLSWFTWVDDAQPCQSSRHSSIGYVNEAGIVLPIAGGERTFSGAVSHFTPSSDFRQVAWLASCDSQLEFYVAQMEPSTPGLVTDVRLAWVGQGSSSAALVLWDGTSVSLNGVDADGGPFFVDVDIDSRIVTDESRFDDPQAPSQVSSMIVGANSIGSFTYWNATAPTSSPSCDSTRNTLWVRSSAGEWQPAITEIPVSTIVAFDIDSVTSHAAVADECDGANAARVIVGTMQTNGSIGGVRVVDIGFFAPGSVSELWWTAPNVLRIHTDNSEFGGEALQFEYEFDEGLVDGILTQLDA